MKKLTILALLIFAFASASAMTVDQFFEKYKNQEDAQYVCLDKEQLMAQIDSVNTEDEKRILASLNKMQALMVMSDDDQNKEMYDDLNSLDGYSPIGLVEKNVSVDESNRLLALFASPTTMIYARGSNDGRLEQPVLACSMMGLGIVCYFDGSFTLEDLENSVNVSFNANFDVNEADDEIEEDADEDVELNIISI